MCIIIDTNQAGNFCKAEAPYMAMLMKWVNKGGRIVCGKPLKKELFEVKRMRGLIKEWERRGQLVEFDDGRIKTCEKKIKDGCKSNDAHIVALAIESKANVIVTEDQDLIKDLKNHKLVGNEIKIYKKPENARPARPHKDMHKRMLEKSDCP